MMTVGLAGLAAKTAAAEWPRATTPVAPGVIFRADVSYLEPTRKEKLDLYLPAAPAGPAGRAAIVYFHGGGWVRGDKATERERNFGNRLATAGYVFASVSYRLGERAWPQNLRDCHDAVRFLRRHAAEYGIDPERIVAMGASAGGHLALMVGYTADLPEFAGDGGTPAVSSRVCAVVNFYGITNLLTRRVVTADSQTTEQLMDSNAPVALGVGRTEGRETWRRASPVAHVRPTSPPTFIVHGLADLTVNSGQATELADTLRENGVEHEVHLLPGIGHLFHLGLSFDLRPLPPHVEPALLAFLARHAGPARNQTGS